MADQDGQALPADRDPALPPVPASAPPEVRMAAGMAYTDNEGYGTRLAFDAAFDVAYAAGVAAGRTADPTADEIQSWLADEWHRDQCMCDDWPAKCLYQHLVPFTWTTDAAVEAFNAIRAARIAEGEDR